MIRVSWCQQCEPQCEPSNRRRRRAWTVKHWPISSAWAKAAETTRAHNVWQHVKRCFRKTTCSHQQQMRGDIKVAANSSVSHLLNASWSLYPIFPLFSSTMWSTVAKTSKLKLCFSGYAACPSYQLLNLYQFATFPPYSWCSCEELRDSAT